MDQLPGNSHRSQRAAAEEPKKIERVVKGEVVTRKKPLLRRMTNSFFTNRADVVADHVFWDVLVPAAKNAVADSGISFINQIMFGSGSAGRASSGRVVGSVGSYGVVGTQQVQYNKVGNPVPGAPGISNRGRARHDFKEIIIPTRVEAEAVLDQMFKQVLEYNAVTVADLYELCGVTPNYTDDKYGWMDIRGAGILLVRDGYILDLPKPEPLD